MMNRQAVSDRIHFSQSPERLNQSRQQQHQQQQQQKSLLFHQITRKSLPYQIVKYVLLILNIMIVATTAIVTIIVCLLPTIIYEKKLALDHATAFLRTGNLSGSQSTGNRRRMHENDIIHLSAQEIDNIRLIRYIILGVSALIILNQTLAVYGLFKERSYHILISTVIIGLIGQLSLFVLPASIFILITIYLIFSICYVILLNHLNLLAREPRLRSARSPSRASSVEPQMARNCCCRCKNCLCNQPQENLYRKPSMQSQPYQNTPYYFGSLGRRGRDSRVLHRSMTPPQPKPTIITNSESIYAQRPPMYRSPGPGLLKPSSVPPTSSNMNLIDPVTPINIYPSQTPQRKNLSGMGNYFGLDRSRDTPIM